MKIIAATQNAHKITEIDAITKGFGLRLCSMKDAGLGDLDIEETGSTFEENSFIKAEAIVRLTGEAAIADDTGLMIDALDGAPGIYSARFSGEHGNDAANRAKVLDLMKDVPEEKRTARFVCVITFLRPDGEKIVAKGACEGKITEKEMGELGFGYDSIFMPDGKDLTFAQMPAEEKNAMSHRARALQALREELLKRPGLAEGAGVKDEAPWRKAYDYWLTCPAISAEDKKELSALTDEKDIEERFISDLKFGTGVRVTRDFANVGKLYSGRRQENMVDPEPHGAHDVEAVLLHQVVDSRDRARRRILDRKDAVCAKPLLHRLEDLLERVEVHDRRHLHETRRRLLCVGALGATARDERARRERILMRSNRVLDLANERRVAFKYAALPRLGNREKRREEKTRRVFVFGASGL